MLRPKHLGHGIVSEDPGVEATNLLEVPVGTQTLHRDICIADRASDGVFRSPHVRVRTHVSEVHLDFAANVQQRLGLVTNRVCYPVLGDKA